MRGRLLVAGLLIASLLPFGAGTSAALEIPLPPLPIPTSVVVPSNLPVPIPQPTRTVVIVSPTPVPGPVRVIEEPGPVRTVPGPERVVEVPGPVETVLVPTPVPGPTKTVFRTEFSPAQERVIEKRIEAEQTKFGLAGIIAGFLVTFLMVCLIAYRFFKKGEIHGLRILRDTI